MCKVKFIPPTIPQGATANERRAIMFKALYSLDLSAVVEKRDNLTYLPWASCFSILKEVYPDATYRVIKNSNGLPYFVDPDLGIMVFTEITVDGITTECFLPVMDAKNKAQKLQPYTYSVWDNYKKTYVEKTVPAADSFSINKAVLRCLVKAVALATGIGLYIYEGEDVPVSDDQTNGQQTTTATTSAPAPVAPPQPVDRFAQIKNAINSKADLVSLDSLYWEHEAEINGNPEIKAVFQQRRSQLQLLAQGRVA